MTVATSLQALIKADAHVHHIMDDAEQTPLHSAARSGCAGAVRALLAAGSKLNPLAITEEFDENGDPISHVAASTLHSAAAAGQTKCLEILIEAAKAAGVSLDAADSFQRTAMHVAAAAGHVECVSALVAAGANANRPNLWGATALYCATQRRHSGVAVSMIDLGADVSAADNRGLTPLHLAARVGDVTLARALVAAGANMAAAAKRVGTPLALAAQTSNTAVAEFLVAAGAPLGSLAEAFTRYDQSVQCALAVCVRLRVLAAVCSMHKFGAQQVAADVLGEALAPDCVSNILCKSFQCEERFLRLLLNIEVGSC